MLGFGPISSAPVSGLSDSAPSIACTGIASGAAFGTPDVSATIAPTGLGSGAAFGTPSLTAVISPVALASGAAFGVPAITGQGVLIPSGIVSGEAFGVPYIGMNPIGIASGAAFGSPTLIGMIASGATWSITDEGRLDWLLNDGSETLLIARPRVVNQVLPTAKHLPAVVAVEKPHADIDDVSYLKPTVLCILIH